MNHYKFTGKERDSESGNDFFGAKFYSGTMGRFMSPDRVLSRSIGGLQQSTVVNLYSYVGNNSTKAR